MDILSFVIKNIQDRFDILLKIRLSGVAKQEYARLSGKSYLYGKGKYYEKGHCGIDVVLCSCRMLPK